MEQVKGRTLEVGQKVRVYLNLNMAGRFSIQDHKSQLVVGYADSVLLKDVVMRISKAGQKRAREQKTRNVHAVVIGTFVSADDIQPHNLNRVGYYNPFKVDCFVDEETFEPIEQCDTLFCFNRRVFFYKEPWPLLQVEENKEKDGKVV